MLESPGPDAASRLVAAVVPMSAGRRDQSHCSLRGSARRRYDVSTDYHRAAVVHVSPTGSNCGGLHALDVPVTVDIGPSLFCPPMH